MEEDKEIDKLNFDINQLINKCIILNKHELTATARVMLGRDIILRFIYILQENKHLKEENKHLSSTSDYETICMECNNLEEQLEIAKSRNKELEQAYKQNENIIDRMIDYIMIHQQVKTMKKIFCKHCKIKNGCTYSGIHRNCVKRYFEYISKQENIN